MILYDPIYIECTVRCGHRHSLDILSDDTRSIRSSLHLVILSRVHNLFPAVQTGHVPISGQSRPRLSERFGLTSHVPRGTPGTRHPRPRAELVDWVPGP
jgi:hypothetical protein